MTRRLDELEGVVDPLAYRARRMRDSYGWTQEDFARACGISKHHLASIEIGRETVGSKSRAALLALLERWEREPPEVRPSMRGARNYAREALKGGGER